MCCVLLQADAQEKFLEVKNAFTVLSDPQQRRDYDRKLKGVCTHAAQAAVTAVVPLETPYLPCAIVLHMLHMWCLVVVCTDFQSQDGRA